MTIEFQDHRSDENSVYFGELKAGQAFQCLYRQGDIYVKVGVDCSEQNAIDLNCLSTGDYSKTSFFKDERIYPVSILISIQDY